MIYKFKSAKYIINKVISLLPSTTEINEEDLLSFISEALGEISSVDMLINLFDVVEIENYVGELPCDFATLRQFSLCGRPVIKNSHTFGPLKDKTSTVETTYQIDGTVYQESDLPQLASSSTVYSNNEYEIRDGFVYTNFESGDLYISYWAYPLDEEGYPLVPDLDIFDTGLRYYCLYMSYMKMWLNNDETARDKMMFFDTKWNDFKPKLRGKAGSPDLNTLENIKRIWLRYTKINQSSTFYGTMNKHQRIYNK